MKESFLVQRLSEPRNWDNPWAFGGGHKNGGLSDDAMKLLRDIWSFDYMGSAEFEYGAVPEALQKIAKAAGANELVAFAVTVPRAEVPPAWDAPEDATVEGDATVYVLCPTEMRDEVEGRINEWARTEPQMQESLRLHGALRPMKKWDKDVCGWLELDNGFAFFVDEVMFTRTCALFGVDHPGIPDGKGRDGEAAGS